MAPPVFGGLSEFALLKSGGAKPEIFECGPQLGAGGIYLIAAVIVEVFELAELPRIEALWCHVPLASPL